MPYFGQKVPRDSLQTEVRLPDNYSGESRTRFVANIKGYCPFNTFNILISSWVASGFELNYITINKLYLEGLEVLRKNPDIKETKGKLIFYVSKIGIDNFQKDSKFFRKYLIDINKFNTILYSPRSLGSEQNKRLRSFSFKIVTTPGRNKSEFPEQAYIGVGYRDKGYCRKQELVGHPSWQEIASDGWYQFKQSLSGRSKIRYHSKLICQDSWRELRINQLRRTKKLRRQNESLLF